MSNNQSVSLDEQVEGTKGPSKVSLVIGAAIFAALGYGLSGIGEQSEGDRPQITSADYDRAYQFLASNKSAYVLNDTIVPNWVRGGDAFWYSRSNTDGGKEFILVDTRDGSKSQAFDHTLIASELTRLTGDTIEANKLPFTSFQYKEDQAISFKVSSTSYVCGLSCEEVETQASPTKPGETASPNGKWALFFKDDNLWLRSLEDNAEFPLSTGGEENYAWGISTSEISSITRKRFGVPDAPLVAFSPDGNKAIIQRIDQRKVENLHLIQHVPEDGTLRPKLYSYPYAFALDDHKPMAEFAVFDLEGKSRVDVNYPKIALNFVPHTHPFLPEVKWQNDGKAFYFIHRDTLGRGFGVYRVDALTGNTSKIAEHVGEQAVFPALSPAAPSVLQPIGEDGVVWWSDADGWGHLYYSDIEGNTRQLTKGDWIVREIVRFDEDTNSIIYLRGTSEADGNPYHTVLESVSLEDGTIRVLAQSPGVRVAGPQYISPNNSVFVDNVSSTSEPGIVSLRGMNTDLNVVLERADISKLESMGTILPEEFQTVAADGKTKLWGKLFKPSDFNSDEKYPVVNYIYPGPQSNSLEMDFSGPRSGLFGNTNGLQALAEMGFIVLTVNSRGTPGRSRAFNYDNSGSLLGEAGYIVDHIASIKQLAETRPYMDIERVGIFGHSGGGYASTHAMLEHPDFYKVAVSGAGNHEQRLYIPIWGESYLGAENGDNYDLASNPEMAANLKGNLLLIVPNMDDNVHPSHSYKLMDALIKADKDFDVLIVPNGNHGFASLANVEGKYASRRMWDYFIEHLHGE